MSAGDIGCTVKLKSTRTGDTLAPAGSHTVISPMVFPEPRYRAAVRAVNQADEEKLGELLNKARYEDPTCWSSTPRSSNRPSYRDRASCISRYCATR